MKFQVLRPANMKITSAVLLKKKIGSGTHRVTQNSVGRGGGG
jgi:hypothetical protein